MNDFVFSLLMLGALSSSGTLPFWMTANTHGLMCEAPGAFAYAGVSTQFDDSKTFQWRWGASFAANAYDNPVLEEQGRFNVLADELYASLRWKALTLDVGQKHRDMDFLASDLALGSVSSTSGHLIESGNARSIPGYLLSLAPVSVPFTNGRLSVYGAYGDYKTLDDRYVEGALIHRMRFGLKASLAPRLTLDLLLDHCALWGGTSPLTGKMPVNIGNYFRVVTGRSAGSSGSLSDRINVIGDQRGSETIRLDWRGDGWKAAFQHDIPYDDGSGMGLLNFPDGVNTVWFGFDDKDRWVSDIAYEYHYTMFQSGPINGEMYDEEGHSLTPEGVKTTGGDNYFNNGEYRSGWTYHGHTIGTPLFYPCGTRAGSWTSASVSAGVENNRIRAHHLGLSGKLFNKHPYKLMLTYSRNYGTYSLPYAGESPWGKKWGTVKETPLNQFSGAFIGFFKDIFGVSGLDGTYGLFLDAGDVLPVSSGLSFGLRYSLNR